MDNKENIGSPATLEPIDNYTPRRRKRQPEDQSLQYTKLLNLNRQLKEQLSNLTKTQQQPSHIQLRVELAEKEAQLARAAQYTESLERSKVQLESEVAIARKSLMEVRGQLTQKSTQLSAREREWQQLLSKSKDQLSRITQLQTYKLKYESMRNVKAQLNRSSEQPKPQQDSDLQTKQFRIALADVQFELKKTQEDTATYKTLSEMDKVRMTKEYELKLATMKKQMEDQNANWLQRFGKRDEEHRREVEEMKTNHSAEREVYQSAMRAEMARLRKMLEGDREQRVNMLQKQLDEERRRFVAQKQSLSESLKKTYEQKIAQLNQQHTNTLTTKKNEYQTHLYSVRSELISQQSNHTRTKEQLTRIKEKLYGDLFTARREKQAVDEQLRLREQSILELKKQLQSQINKLVDTEEFHVQQLARLRMEHRQTLTNAEEQMRGQIKTVLNDYMKTTEGLSTQLKQLQQNNLEQQTAYQKQVDELSGYFQQRPSRQQDLKTIQQLQGKLMRKQAQLEMVAKELKWHRLELQNKQDTYNRIFASGIQEVRIPTDHITGNKLQQVRDFKFRKVARSLLQQKQVAKGQNNR